MRHSMCPVSLVVKYILSTLMCHQTAKDHTPGEFFPRNIERTKWNWEVIIRWQVLMTI